MITFQKLEWSNCFSYGKNNTLDLNAEALTQIIGLNGAGKSSVPLLLEETLYNKNSRGIKKADIANRLLDGTYNVALDFLVDGVQHRVEITRNKVGVKAKLFRDGQDISDHTASNTFKSIEQILRIDHKTFSQLIYQGISSSLQFLTAPDTARKKFLVDLFGLEAYLEYFEKFKELAKTVSSQVSTIEGKVSTIEKWLTDNKLDNLEIINKLDIPEIDNSLEKDLAELRLSAKNIDNTNSRIRANTLAKERIKELDTSSISVGITSPHETASIHSKLGGLKSEAATVKTAIDKFNKLPGRCPTCSQTIGEEFSSKYKEAASTKLNKLTKEIQLLEQELTSKLEENKLLNKKQSIEREFESLYNSIDDSLPEELLVKNDIEKRAKEIEATIKAQKTKIEELITKNNMIERHNTKVSIYLEQHDKLKTQLEENRIALESLISLNTNIEVLKRAFSTNGLIAYKLEGLVKELEDLTNSYLAELSDGRFTIEFCIEKDKLNVVITDNGNDVTITALSSGELSRVNTATLLAIRRLMSSISKSRINVLFLDEVINVLDEYGREKLIEVLMKEDKLNSFIVSHQWSHPLLAKVTVLKEKGISRIECQ